MSLLGAEAILSRKQKQPKAYCRPNECLVLGFAMEPVCVGARGRRKERGAHSLSGAGQPTPPGSLSSDQIFSPAFLCSPPMGQRGFSWSLVVLMGPMFTSAGSCRYKVEQAGEERLALQMVELRLV